MTKFIFMCDSVVWFAFMLKCIVIQLYFSGLYRPVSETLVDEIRQSKGFLLVLNSNE